MYEILDPSPSGGGKGEGGPHQASEVNRCTPAPLPEGKVLVKYFAVLREQAGVDEEAINAGVTVADTYALLQSRHGFTLRQDLVRFAIRGRFVPPTTLLEPGDELVIIPPVAGG